MKKYFLSIFAALAVSESMAGAGDLILNRELRFSDEELSSGAATKELAIHSSEPGSPETAAWDSAGVSLLHGNRLCMTDALSVDSWVTWRVTLPAKVSVKKVTFGIKQIILDGAKGFSGDDKLGVSFSLDGENWVQIEEMENMGGQSGTKTVSNFTCEKDIEEPGVSEFYVRVGHIEGAEIEADSGYWALVANPGPEGGSSPESFISVVVNR